MVGLVAIIFIALQIPSVQQFAAQKGASYLSGMLKTKVEIGGLTTDWRNSIVLKKVYIEDQQRDTLWYSERLGVDMRIFALLNGEVDINKLSLEHATVNLHIRPDSTSNFGFIMDAFATDTTVAVQPADTAAMKINLGLIGLEDVRVKFNDEYSGNLINAKVGSLVTTMDEIDLDKEIYRIDEITLKNSAVTMVQSKLMPDEEPQPITMNFGLNKVTVQNFKLDYKSTVADQAIKLSIGESELVAKNIDLPNARIDLTSFDLHNSAIAYGQGKYIYTDSLAIDPVKIVEDLDKSVEKTQGQPVNWVLNLGKLDITGVQAAVDNFKTLAKKRGMDFDHILLKDVNVQAEDFLYSQNRMRLDLNQLKLVEKSGFRIDTFQADIKLDSTRASLTGLNLKTGHSHIVKQLAMNYPSLEALSEKPEVVELDVDIENSKIGLPDILYFMPELADNPSFRAIANSTVKVDSRIGGTMDDLKVDRLVVSGLQGTNINVNGRVHNVTNPDKLFLDLKINRLATTRTDILALAPRGSVPKEIRLPAALSMNGTYKGTLTNFTTNANIQSSFGNVNAVAAVNMGPKNRETFNVTVKSSRFNVGQLLTEDYGLGVVALNGTAKGTGLTPETMVAKINAHITEANYNNYAYKNIDLDASINRNVYAVNATAKDNNLNFKLAGDFNLRNAKTPGFDFDLDLNNVNLKALNLYADDLALEGRIKGKLTGSTPKTLAGNIDARNLTVRHKNVKYPIDSLLVTLKQNGPASNIQIASDLLAANLNFENDIATLPVALQKHFSNYFDLQPDQPYPANTNLRSFNFDLTLRKTGLIISFVSGLTQLDINGPVTGSYNAVNKEFLMDGSFRQIKYTDYSLTGTKLEIRGNAEQLGYNVAVKNVTSPQLKANNVTLAGAARDNDLTTKISILEDNGQEKFVVGGLLNSLGPGYKFIFNPDQLVINRDKWNVSPDNFLQFDTNLLYANNIRLERAGSFIALNSTGPIGPNAPMNVEIKNFSIGYLLRSFEQDTLMDGTINGTATLRSFMDGNPAFTSNLTVTDFKYMNVPVGNLALLANNEGGNRYNIEGSLTGQGNNVLVNGFYEAQPTAGILNLTANIPNLNMASLQGFTAGMVKDMAGSANGQLRITGTVADPDIAGQLNFTQAQFNIAMLNSLYKLQNERITFTEAGINFPNFTMTDVNNNTLVVNGTIFTKTYTDLRFDLTAKTDRFLAMNSTAKDNDLYYGKLLIAANATITGNQIQPDVNFKATVLEGSALTAVVPADESGAAAREGIVVFIDRSDTAAARLRRQARAQQQAENFRGVDIDGTFTITDASEVTVIVDPLTGDNLVVRGNGTFITGITPAGQISLTGRYEVTEGKYRMAFYDLASRELDLAPGGYVAWSGDPFQAEMRISAIYRAKASPAELVAAEIGGLGQTEQNRFRTQLPFEVYVNLEGEMLKPEIDFDIQLPEQNRSAHGGQVEAKLAALRTDESEMNKQVFALLVLGRFLAPDPLSSSGGGLDATARNSLSQVMSDQLNKLTESFAGGIGLELGVNSYEDYSSGSAQGRTDLNVALKQQFLNDRLTVRVGTDIGLEGQGQSQSSSSGFGGDVSVEYSLTPDGRLRVRGFRRNEYESFVEGDVQSTGLSLIYVRDYDNFADLFSSVEKAKQRAQKRAEREREKSMEVGAKL